MKYRLKKPEDVVEAYQHNGSSTSVERMREWVKGGPCPEQGGIHTCDIKDFIMCIEEGNGILLDATLKVRIGEWLVRSLFMVG